MRRIHALGAAAVISILLPSAAYAQTAYSTADVNMRAGPGTQYPVVTTVPDDRAVTVHGCAASFNWCDVSWRGRRGWVYAEYLGYPRGGTRVAVTEFGPRIGLPVISFNFGTYWDRHYRHEPWYSERSRWRVGRRYDDNRWRRGDGWRHDRWREGRRGDRDWRDRRDWREGRRGDRNWRESRGEDRRWRERNRADDRRDARRDRRDRDRGEMTGQSDRRSRPNDRGTFGGGEPRRSSASPG